mmetsp:Transcript_32674/g.73810  ORF Transcript_32674/g.73810 Transcript_32674/m.73810 type:complete len:223 (+) Transcript_32674:218-886(+)
MIQDIMSAALQPPMSLPRSQASQCTSRPCASRSPSTRPELHSPRCPPPPPTLCRAIVTSSLATSLASSPAADGGACWSKPSPPRSFTRRPPGQSRPGLPTLPLTPSCHICGSSCCELCELCSLASLARPPRLATDPAASLRASSSPAAASLPAASPLAEGSGLGRSASSYERRTGTRSHSCCGDDASATSAISPIADWRASGDTSGASTRICAMSCLSCVSH